MHEIMLYTGSTAGESLIMSDAFDLLILTSSQFPLSIVSKSSTPGLLKISSSDDLSL